MGNCQKGAPSAKRYRQTSHFGIAMRLDEIVFYLKKNHCSMDFTVKSLRLGQGDQEITWLRDDLASYSSVEK